MQKIKLFIAFSMAAVMTFACSPANTVNNTSPNSVNQTNSSAVSNTAPANTGAADDLASAKKIYSEKCIKCHKEDGKGGVTDFDGTKIKAPDLTSDRQKTKPDTDYIDIIEKGASEDGMPAFKGKISDDEIKNLVKYIRRDFQGK